MKKDIKTEQKLVDKMSELICSKYLNDAMIILQQNEGNDSVMIKIKNNSWRNGVIKGDLLLAKIKTSGKVQYINIKEKYSDFINKMNIEYSSTKTERTAGMIRIALSDFIRLIDNSTDTFKKFVNTMFLDSISFPEFGCCSKYEECEKEGKCLHVDQLYATSCQYQKLMKRTGKFE